MPTLRSLARSLLLASLVFGTSLASAWAPRAWGEDATTLEFPDTPLVERTVKGAKVQSPRHDFGVVAQQAEVTATIPYRNAGTTAVEGLRVKSGCSCFGATLSERTLAPGATGTLTVRLRSGSMKGTVEKPLRLLYRKGSAQAMVELRIRAKVIAGILVERVWFGEIRAGTKPTASAPIAWFHGVGTPFEITKIDVPGPKVSTRVEKYEIAGGTTYRGWTVHYTFEEPPRKGVYSRKALVHTTDPKHPVVEVPLTATVVGNVWLQTSHISLGFVPVGTARSATVKIKASGKDAPPLQSVQVKARAGILQTAVSDGFDPFVGPHKVITVTVPAGTAPGILDDVLEIRTDLPGGEVTKVKVRGRVYKPQGPK